MILYIKLVSESFIAIPTMYDTAVLETCLKDGMLHHEIVAMCVYADGTVVLLSVLQHLPEDAFDLSAAGDAMDGGIGGVVQPSSVVYDIVGRVYTAPQDEGGHDMIVLDADVAVATLDVLPQEVIAGVTVGPLVGVACLGHEPAGSGENLLHARNV